MQNIIPILEKNIAYIILFLFALSIIEIIYILILNTKFIKINSKYKKVIKSLNKGDIFDAVSEISKENEDIKEDLKKMQLNYNMLEKEVKTSIKKVGIVRYNAFSDVGSDLSFSIALLDSNDNGIIISGIYGRNDTATFAKPIEKSQSKYPLSAEEIQAIERAKKKAL
ncbi:MAG: DUF4446 family protein [Thermoanaerobacteraceae bacterium]